MLTTEWQRVEEPNEWTGVVRVRHLRKYSNHEDAARVYSQIYELDGRIYWSANIYIPFRPDLSRLAYGTYAAIPGAMAVAKMRASRLAMDTLRKAGKLTLAA